MPNDDAALNPKNETRMLQRIMIRGAGARYRGGEMRGERVRDCARGVTDDSHISYLSLRQSHCILNYCNYSYFKVLYKYRESNQI